MRVNLTKVIRWIVVLMILAIVCNVLTFLYGPKNGIPGVSLNKLSQDTIRPEIRLTSTETCKGLGMKRIPDAAIFQKVGEDNVSYVYSAFLQDISAIRIVGLRQLAGVTNTKFFCQIWFSDVQHGDPLVIGEASTELIPEDHNRKYTSVYYLCPVPNKFPNKSPYAVSLVRSSCDPATNAMLVQGPGSRLHEFMLCVTPLNYKYSRAYELVEMIEMNKLLGAQKIVFYNHSTGPNVDQVLEYYKQKGEVEVNPWHLPIKTDTWPPTHEPEVHYFAQMAALNDCLFRHRNRSQYLVYTDLDEFIVPRQHSTWREMMEDNEKTTSMLSYVQAQCTFFRKEWPKPAEQFLAAVEKYSSVILKHTVREKNIYPHGSRSKYIINPRLVTTVGIHNVWSYTGSMVALQDSTALLHHYRTWEQPNDQQARVEDLTAVTKYGRDLALKLDRLWSELGNVPQNINISSYGPFVS